MNRSGRDTISRKTSSTGYGGSQRSQDISDDYWEKLFSGTDYYDLYQSIMNSYGVAPPNTFWGALTGQNKTNAYQHEMSKRDELSALAEKMYNEQYNSYANQSQMMRQAGYNPDLLGVTGGASSEMSPDGVNPNVSSANGLQVAGSLVSTVMSAVGVANSIMSSMSTGLALDSQRIANINSMDKFALSFLLDQVDPQSVVNDELSDEKRSDIISSASDFGKKFYGFNRRQQRSFTDSVIRKLDSPQFFEEYYGFMKRGAENRKSFITDTTGDFYSDQDEVMRILFHEIISSQQLASKHKAKFESDYYGTLDGNVLASAENSVAERISSENLESKYSNSFRRSINSKLGKAFNDGNIFAGVVLALINDMNRSHEDLLQLLPSAIGTFGKKR